MTELSYLTCVFHAVRPFFWYQGQSHLQVKYQVHNYKKKPLWGHSYFTNTSRFVCFLFVFHKALSCLFIFYFFNILINCCWFACFFVCLLDFFFFLIILLSFQSLSVPFKYVNEIDEEPCS